MRAPRWQSKEDDVLREHFPRGGMSVVRDLLPGRSDNGIRGRLAALGIRCDWHAVIRKPPRPKGHEATGREIGFWFALYVLSERPRVPDLKQIMERWNVSIATAHRWHRWACDELAKIQAERATP